MPPGIHWEWRGFGNLPDSARKEIEAFEPVFAAPQQVTDEYLWISGSAINVKLRSAGNGSLKFKRLRERDGETGLELWEERPDEEYSFPVSPDAVDAMALALGLKVPRQSGATSREELLELLRASGAQVERVTVTKVRRARRIPTSDGSVIVDVADISTPEKITSVGVEHEADLGSNPSSTDSSRARRSVLAAVAQLGLPELLTTRNYVNVVGVWALKDSIAMGNTSEAGRTRQPVAPTLS